MGFLDDLICFDIYSGEVCLQGYDYGGLGLYFVLLYGMQDFVFSFDLFVCLFVVVYCVIMFDLCGYGDFDKLGIYILLYMIVDLYVVILQFGFEWLWFVGYSFGGQIVLQYVVVFFEVLFCVVNVEGIGGFMCESDIFVDDQQWCFCGGIEGLFQFGGCVGCLMVDL